MHIVFKISAMWINTEDDKDDSWCWKLEGRRWDFLNTFCLFDPAESATPLYLSLTRLRFSCDEFCRAHLLQLHFYFEDT